MGIDVGPPRPKGYVRHISDASDASSSINLHSLPIPEPQTSQGGKRKKKCLLLSIAFLVVVAVAVGLSLGLTTVAKNNSEISASTSTSGSADTGSAPKDGTLKSIKAFYSHDEEIRLRFIDPNPDKDHWIGITRAKADETNLMSEDVEYWAFACGSRSCTEVLDSGKVKIPQGKLSPGRYKAHLIIDSEAPYTAIKSSKAFVIKPEESVEEVEKDAVVTASPTASPTKKPTVKLTKKPTNAPTAAPTVSKIVAVKEDEAAPLGASAIQSKHPTYGKKHTVHVSFTNADAQRLDWVAIAKPGSEDGKRLDEKAQLVAWVYACGTTSCSRKKEEGNLTFDGGVIPPGTWQAYLVKNDRYTIKAMSAPFTIVKGDFDQDEVVSENRGS